MAEEEATPPPTETEKPFFAIDAEDLANASTASSPPPTPMVMGTLGGDSTNSTPQEANPWGGSTPQLSGNVMASSGQQMFTVPGVSQKERFRWGQFFIGLATPFAVFIIVAMIGNAVDPSWDDAYRFEVITVESQDGVNFEYQLQPESDEVFNYFTTGFDDEESYVYISCWGEPFEDEQNNIVVTQQTDYRREVSIGQYYPSNQTIAFTLSEGSADRLDFAIEYVDADLEDKEERATTYFDTVFCLLPLGFIVATGTSFVKGNRALGYGLLTSLFLGVVGGPLLFLLVLLLAFGV
jgi:hypothetical protein